MGILKNSQTRNNNNIYFQILVNDTAELVGYRGNLATVSKCGSQRNLVQKPVFF